MTKLSDVEFQKIVTDVMFINRTLMDKEKLLGMSGDVLSYTAIKLASMKSLIIDVKASAEREAKDAEADYKKVKADALRRLIGSEMSEGGPKISATAASELVYGEEDVLEAYKHKNELEAFFGKLKSLSADTHDCIDSIKSRVIDLQGARKDERVS